VIGENARPDSFQSPPMAPRFRLSVALLAALSVSACATVAPAPVAPTPAPAPVAAGPAANDNLNAVLWMQTSVEYRVLAGQTYVAALQQLDRAFKNPDWDALAADDRAGGAVRALKKAVIVDVDETVLDNTPFQARLVANDTEYSDPAWDAWVDEKKAPAVPGALPFLQQAAARGVEVFYISNRTAAQGPATVQNLADLHFPFADADHYFGKGTEIPGCPLTPASSSDKGCRRWHVGQTHRVLMQVGDQLGDFVDPKTNSLGDREAAIRPYQAWIGQRWFVLPNPTYGNWERALYGKGDTTEAAKRASKRAALRQGNQ
jgi:acid phosphatase